MTADVKAFVKPVRVAIYLRISSDPMGQEEGVERQHQDCTARLNREDNWVLVRIYEDNDISASSRSKKPRPDYEAMLADTKAGKIDVILSYSNSRLTRRPRELEDLIQLHEETGVQLKTIVSGDDDLSTADGRMMARLKATIDANEAERTGERRKRELLAKRQAGKHAGRRPFGWYGTGISPRTGKEMLTAHLLHPKEGPALKAAIKAILAGHSVTSIARRWNKRGLLTASGNPWDLTNLRFALTRWRNAGLVEHQGTPVEVTAEDGTVEAVRGLWKPVCTREELEELRGILLAPEKRGKHGPKSTTLMASLAVCGKCGRTMVSGSQRKSRKEPGVRIRNYRCAGAQAHQAERCFVTIQGSILDDVVRERIRKLLWFGDLGTLGPSPSDLVRIAELRKERSENVAEEAEYGQMLAERTISLVSAKPALKALNERRDVIDTELEEIMGRLPLKSLLGSPVAQGNRVSFDRAAEIANDFDSLELGQKREVIKALVTVTVNPGRGLDQRIEVRRRDTGELLTGLDDDNQINAEVAS